MKLAIFGASGRTGTETVKLSLEKGYQVTASVRDPRRIKIEDENLTLIAGDVLDTSSVNKAIKGQDTVICALGGGDDLKKTNVRTIGTINIINAMDKEKVKRLVVISAMGIGKSRKSLSFINRVLISTVLKNSMEDHESQEKAVMESGLDWTIITPSGLTDTPRTGKYLVGENVHADTSRIARADVADLILRELDENKMVGNAVTITN